MRTYSALGATLLLLLVTLGSVWSIAAAAPSAAPDIAPSSAPAAAPGSAADEAPLAAPPAAPLYSVAERPDAAAPAQRGEPSTCTGYNRETGVSYQSRTVQPDDILDCHTSTVSITVGADCDKVPLHVVLDVDRSGSMVGQPIEEVKAAARALIQALDMSDPKNSHIKIGLVSHGDPATIDSQLTDRSGQISARVGNMIAGGEDNLSDSLGKSHSVLRTGRKGDIAPFEVAVVLSDGGQTYPPSMGVQA
ncbi:MAG: vWA domain-containing protein, partial [Anaerolineae bacterium]